MKKNYSLLIVFIIISSYLFGQECNCAENFKWVRKIFEQNDAGFQYIIDKKGIDNYNILNNNITKKAQKIGTLSSCQSLIYEWSKFFRVGHFGFSIVKNNYNQNPSFDSNLMITQPKVNLDLSSFEKRIDSITQPTFEGIWEDGTYKVGIIKNKNSYQGFIINAANTNWIPRLLKFTIDSSEKKASLWMRDFSKESNLDVDLIGNNLINIGNIMYLKRISKNYTDTKEIKDYIKFLYTGNISYVQKLSDRTAYIRIPAFDLDYKKQIDSVLMANANILKNTNNLIIDLRYNGGGADISYHKLIPYLYTNPIRTIGLQFLSTPLNNQIMLSLSQNNNFDKETQKEYKAAYDTLNKYIGKFVTLSKNIISEKKLDKILPFPKNIAVLINNGNASTTEQFLLAAKQSRKVKLYGTTTMGALDISNLNDITSPDGNFELTYCRSKSYRIPDMAIDGKGIQPDYYIDNSIPNKEWVSYVQKLLEN